MTRGLVPVRLIHLTRNMDVKRNEDSISEPGAPSNEHFAILFSKPANTEDNGFRAHS